jgi:hypothetical protein
MHEALRIVRVACSSLKKLALHTMFSWRVTWFISHVYTFSDFLVLCASFST